MYAYSGWPIWLFYSLINRQAYVLCLLTVFFNLDTWLILRPAIMAIRELKFPMLMHSFPTSKKYSITFTLFFFFKCWNWKQNELKYLLNIHFLLWTNRSHHAITGTIKSATKYLYIKFLVLLISVYKCSFHFLNIFKMPWAH